MRKCEKKARQTRLRSTPALPTFSRLTQAQARPSAAQLPSFYDVPGASGSFFWLLPLLPEWERASFARLSLLVGQEPITTMRRLAQVAVPDLGRGKEGVEALSGKSKPAADVGHAAWAGGWRAAARERLSLICPFSME